MKNQLEKIVKISKALGDINRLKILQLIAKGGGTGQCAAILESINLAQPSISHHIKILTDAGLIEVQKEGRHHTYMLSQESIRYYLQTLAGQICPEPN